VPKIQSLLLAPLRELLRMEAAGGILLVVMAAIAMALQNSPLAPWYAAFIDTPVVISVGGFAIAKPLLLWINDGLMAVFFFLVGLELKREVLEGELATPAQAALPALGALGGMLVPALIYAVINRHDPVTLQGWAIPAATDIAFALGVLSLLGQRVPAPLRLFLVTLAVLDDLGAIVVIAIFYTAQLSMASLAVAGTALVVLIALNVRGVTNVAVYLLIGLVMWASVLKSGVHATLAGVVLALVIPMRDPRDQAYSPVESLEHDLRTPVSFVILPLFAFANAGVSFAGMNLGSLLAPVPLGIAAGLFAGKQLGVFGAAWLGIRLGLARLPAGTTWAQLYATSILCGIGFTMSLFIGTLAFEHSGQEYASQVRLGIVVGSLVSAVIGYLVLKRALRGR
jgi:NhaA family Na+:H+ antiporter